MNKINNKLIFIFAILAFIFMVSTPIKAKAERPYYTPYYYFNPSQNNYPVPVAVNTFTIIQGCEGRNTGFSTITGQSCVGNYIVDNTPPRTIATTTTTTKVTNNSTANNTTTDNNSTDTTASTKKDTTNDSYGGLAASALLGSNTFLPSGLLQWIFFILIIVAIIFLWRYVHAEEKYMSEPLKHS